MSSLRLGIIAASASAIALVCFACGSFSSSDDAALTDAGSDGPGSSGETGTTEDGGVPDSGKVTCNGLCPTSVIGESENAIPWLALDANRVVWMTGPVEGGGLTDVLACPKSGCVNGKPTAIATQIPGGYLTSDGNTVFVSGSFQNYGVRRLDGEILQPLVPSLNMVYAMVARDGTLFYVNYFTPDAGVLGRRISRVDFNGANASELGVYAPEPGINTSAFVVAKERVFLGSHSTTDIAACSIANCTFTKIADTYGFAMATDDARLFTMNGGALVSCGVADVTCVPRAELPERFGTPITLIHHEGSLFIEIENGDMVECQSKDCQTTAKVVAHEEAFDTSAILGATNFAADSSAVYYVAKVGTTYRVKRLPRTKP